MAAREMGATRVRARLLTRPNRRGWSGWTSYRIDGDRKRDEAVIVLAGDVAAKGSSPDDQKTARKLLRGSGTSLKEARKAAENLVRENRREIERTARRLRRRGRI